VFLKTANVITRHPTVAHFIFCARLLLVLGCCGVFLFGGARPQDHDRVTKIEQRFDDFEKSYVGKVQDIEVIRAKIDKLALDFESRTSKLEANSDFIGRMLFLVVGAIFLQLLETLFSYMRVKRSLGPEPKKKHNILEG